MPLISVTIPAYNAGKTLERTLRSVLAQSHSDLEIFVVDDGSKDDTAAIAHDIARHDQRIKVLSQKNSGVAAARNYGLRQATGSFVCWLDADDLWHPTKVEKQLETFFSAPVRPSFVYSGYRLIDSDDRIIPNIRALSDVSGNTMCRQIATNFFSNVSSLLVPIENARRFGGHDERLRALGIEGAEDLLLQLQLSSIGPVACRKEALVGYRMHENNMSRGHARAAQSNLKAIDLVSETQPDIPDWVIDLGKSRTVGYALYMLRDGDLKGAVRLFGQLMRGQPIYTLLNLLLIIQWQIKKVGCVKCIKDPDVGRAFLEADPAAAPWQDHMVLTEMHRRKLDRADLKRQCGGRGDILVGLTNE